MHSHDPTLVVIHVVSNKKISLLTSCINPIDGKSQVSSRMLIWFNYLIADTFKTPGPGTYRPEKVHPQGERHAPTYSMGSRTRYRKRKL